MGTGSHPGCSTFNLDPCWCGRKAGQDGQRPWAPTPVRETGKRFLTPGFRTARLTPLQPLGMNQRCKTSLFFLYFCISDFEAITNKSTFKYLISCVLHYHSSRCEEILELMHCSLEIHTQLKTATERLEKFQKSTTLFLSFCAYKEDWLHFIFPVSSLCFYLPSPPTFHLLSLPLLQYISLYVTVLR